MRLEKKQKMIRMWKQITTQLRSLRMNEQRCSHYISLSLILLAFCFLNGCEFIKRQNATLIYAKYKNLTFEIDPETKMITDMHSGKSFNRDGLAKLYLKPEGYPPVLLDDFTEELAWEFIAKKNPENRRSSYDEKNKQKRSSYGEFKFRDNLVSFVDGRLKYISCNFKDVPIKISVSKKGPFLSFPFSEQEMIKQFGYPLEYEYLRPRAP